MGFSLNNGTIIVQGNFSDDMSDMEFYNFCQQNELFKIELDEIGKLL